MKVGIRLFIPFSWLTLPTLLTLPQPPQQSRIQCRGATRRDMAPNFWGSRWSPSYN